MNSVWSSAGFAAIGASTLAACQSVPGRFSVRLHTLEITGSRIRRLRIHRTRRPSVFALALDLQNSAPDRYRHSVRTIVRLKLTHQILNVEVNGGL